MNKKVEALLGTVGAIITQILAIVAVLTTVIFAYAIQIALCIALPVYVIFALYKHFFM